VTDTSIIADHSRTTAKDGLSAYNRSDMKRLASLVSAVDDEHRKPFAATLMANRIMVPRQWWVRFSVWVIQRRSKVGLYSAWLHVLTTLPQIVDEMIEQTADWIENGKEADGLGVGGLNQREVDLLAGLFGIGAVAHHSSPDPKVQAAWYI